MSVANLVAPGVPDFALAPAGAVPPAPEAPPAVPEKKVWKKEPLPRIPSELGFALQTYTEHGSRAKYNKHKVSFQCEAVLGPIKGTVRTCWLCGFPIQHLTHLRDEAGKPVFTLATPMLDKATCDHVLPVKLAHAILELLYITEDPRDPKLLHTEYEYAHNFCNIYKSDEYFVSLPLGSRDLCSLEIKHEILDAILRRIFYKVRGAPNSSQFSGVKTEYNGKSLFFPNIVQAYCFTSDPEAFLNDKHRFFRQRWFPSVKRMIVRKVENIIRYVKEADGCLSPERGLLFKGIPDRLLTGRENLPKGFKGPSVTRLEGSTARRVGELQRAPSFEDILAITPQEERVIAFSAEPYDGYSVDVRKIGSNSNNNSEKKKKSRRKKKNDKNEEFDSENVVNAANALNAAALAAAGAGAGPAVAAEFLEARGDYLEAVAEDLAAEAAANAIAARREEPVPAAANNNAPAENIGLPMNGGRRRLRRYRKTRKLK
jgi:hypothetical protein